MFVINVVMCVVHGTWLHMGSWRVDVEGTILHKCKTLKSSVIIII